MISLFMWLGLGALTGYSAKLIIPIVDEEGVIITTLFGIIGAIIGGISSTILGFGAVNSISNIGNAIPTHIFSMMGAIAVVYFYYFTMKKSTMAKSEAV